MIVVDAKVVLALVLPLSYSDAAAKCFKSWKLAGQKIYSPALLEYEYVSALRRAVTVKWLTQAEAVGAVRQMKGLNLSAGLPSENLNIAALCWAERLGQSKAYDAQYLAYAENLGAEFWTADNRLFERARQLGAAWVHWIEEKG